MLADEQQFSIFWQWPHFIVYHKLKFVDVVAYLIEQWEYGVMICDGFCPHAFNLVCNFACAYHLLDFLADNHHVVGYFFNHF